MPTHIGRAPIAPAAQPIDIQSLVRQAPLPIGGLTVGRPSPAEERKLREHGWTGQGQVPENLEEIAEAVRREVSRLPLENEDEMRAETEQRYREQQGPMNTREVDMRSLPPAQRAVYEKVMAEIISQTEQMAAEPEELPATLSPGIADALRHAEVPKVPMANDLAAPTYASGMPKEKAPAEEEEPDKPDSLPAPEKGFCARCGYPKALQEDLDVPAEEVTNYALSVFSLKPYTRTMWIMGDRVSVAIRTLSSQELDLVFNQLHRDRGAGLILSEAEEVEYYTRYRLSMQLLGIKTPVEDFVFPKSLAEWSFTPEEQEREKTEGRLRVAMTHVQGKLGVNESLWRVLGALINQFNAEVVKMEKMVRDPNFFKAIGC